jgi:hypothetical protein
MHNILAITLGTRDLQFDMEELLRSDIECNQKVTEKGILSFEINTKNGAIEVNKDGHLTSPYHGGKIISESEELLAYIKWPIIEETLRKYIRKADKVLLVSTEQKDAAEYHQKRDTKYFSKLLKKYLIQEYKLDPQNIQEEVICEQVTNIDHLYIKWEDLHKGKKSIFQVNKDQIEHVYLLAQGGIDQINTALTLKLIEYFPNKLTQIQKGEGEPAKELEFPKLFISNLQKHKIQQLLDRYDFNGVFTLSDDERIKQMCHYADLRLKLQHDQILQNVTLSLIDQQIGNLQSNPQSTFSLEKQKITDLYLSAKIDFYRQDYPEFIWKMFTVSENLHRVFIEDALQEKIHSKYYDRSSTGKYNEEFRSFIAKFPKLQDSLYAKGIKIDNPNRRFYNCFLNYLFSRKMFPFSDKITNNLNRAFNLIEPYVESRHRIAHNMGSISVLEIIPEKQKEIITDDKGAIQYIENSLFKSMDTALEIKNLGIYQEIKEKILISL